MITRYFRGTTEQNNALTLPAGRISIDIDKPALRIHDGVTPGGFELPAKRAVDLGPGPVTFVGGTMQAGFFGELSSEELFDRYELIDATGVSEGQAMPQPLRWLKFAYQGKILYIAKTPLSHSVSWETLYQAGLVYGLEGPGPFPSPSGNSVEQLFPLGKDEWLFKLRLLTGAGDDPVSIGSGHINDPTQGVGSEWNDLFYRVCDINPTTQDVANNPNWADYTQAELGVASGDGSRSWTQESRESDTAVGIARGSGIGHMATNLQKIQLVSNNGWRPVLELIPAEDLLLPVMSITNATAALTSPTVSATQGSGTLSRVTEVEYTDSSLTAPTITAMTFQDSLARVTDVTYSGFLTPPSFDF